ncbi:protein lifeguard 1 isoform X1 [Gasterosteus aculeatus]
MIQTTAFICSTIGNVVLAVLKLHQVYLYIPGEGNIPPGVKQMNVGINLPVLLLLSRPRSALRGAQPVTQSSERTQHEAKLRQQTDMNGLIEPRLPAPLLFSSRMSNSPEPLVSKGTQDAPHYVSSPPPAPPAPSPPGDTVFCVLTLQMLFSFGVLCASFSGGKEGRTNKWLYVSSLLTFSGFAVALSICKSFSQRHPWNIVGCVVVTVSLSHMVGTIASFLDLNHVFVTVGVLMVIAFAIVAFSAKTHHHDVWDGLLMTLTVDVVAFAFLHLLLPRHL